MKDVDARIANLSPEKRALLERLVNRERLADTQRGSAGDAISVLPRKSKIMLSYAQERLWFVNQIEGGQTPYNNLLPLRLQGRLEVRALERALSEIIARHEILRTTFPMVDGTPEQCIHDPLPCTLVCTDLRHLHLNAQDEKVLELADAQTAQRFALVDGPLIRSSLLILDDTESVLLLTLHHIVTDEWSTDILIRELITLYHSFANGLPSPLPALPIQYADYAAWQRGRLQGEVLRRQLDYWREKLADAETLRLSTDHARPSLQSFAGARINRIMSRQLKEQVKALARSAGATPFMLLLTAFVVLLRHYSGQEDILVGSPVAGRGRKELEGLIGFFVNTLVLRTDLSGNPTFSELLERVRQVVLGAYSHQDIPFEKLVDEFKPVRDLSRNALFQVAFSVLNAPESLSNSASQSLRISLVPVALRTARCDLECNVLETADNLGARLVYNTDLFDASTISRMLEHYERLLHAVVAAPESRVDELDLLTAEERQQLLVQWNPYPDPRQPSDTVLARFHACALRDPEAVAAEYGERRLSYADLDAQTNALARYLMAQGVTPGDRVGVCVERGLLFVQAVLAVWKAGAAYLPLDPAYPQSRLRFMLQDAQVVCVLTQASLVERMRTVAGDQRLLDITSATVAGFAQDEIPDKPEAHDLAYMIYTSGSTGDPKGALLEHGGLSNVAAEQIHRFTVGPGDRVLQFSSPSFDAATFDLVMALASGAALVLADAHHLQPGPPLARLLHEESVTVLTIPPSALGALPADGLPSLSVLNIAGEACSSQLVERWMVPGRRVFNLYGPTEATIWSTFAECVADGQPPPIGRPIGNVRCYVLDRQGQLVPRGVAGELYIGGVGVARGYWKREEQSTQRFLPDPFIEDPKARMYRTGDLVRWRADGQLEFQGRIDTQVKVRGFRIELGEVEAVLRRHPGVGEAVVECREDAPGDRRLVAYLVAERSAPPPVPEIRDFVSARLPGYMVPASWVVLPALPLTPNGKVDRKALPAPDGERQLDDPFVAARNELEADICTIWCEVLQLNRVGIDDNFFELGGNSLLLIRMRSLLAERLGREVPVVDLFESPTIRLLASRCAKHIDGAAGRHSVQALSKVHARARSQRKAMRERQEAAE